MFNAARPNSEGYTLSLDFFASVIDSPVRIAHWATTPREDSDLRSDMPTAWQAVADGDAFG
jgi:hypothetical protein